MPRPKGSKNKVEGKSKRQDILDAAIIVFAHYGFEGATLEKIAETAGCTRPLVLQYFGSKEALAKRCSTQFIENFFKILRRIHDRAPSYAEANRQARQQFILHRDKWRFLLGVMCIPALEALRAGLLPQYLEISRNAMKEWADEFQRPESTQHFFSSLHFCYLFGGNEKNYLEATDDLIRQYIKPEYLK